jgi:hypothetical protein
MAATQLRDGTGMKWVRSGEVASLELSCSFDSSRRLLPAAERRYDRGACFKKGLSRPCRARNAIRVDKATFAFRNRWMRFKSPRPVATASRQTNPFFQRCLAGYSAHA